MGLLHTAHQAILQDCEGTPLTCIIQEITFIYVSYRESLLSMHHTGNHFLLAFTVYKQVYAITQ